MTYPETLTQKPQLHAAFLMFNPYNEDGAQIGWTRLEYSYYEQDFVFKRSEMQVFAERPYPYISDEDIVTALKDMYSDKNITEIVIS